MFRVRDLVNTTILTFDDGVEAGAQPAACDHGSVHRLRIPPDELRRVGTHAALRQRVVARRRLCMRMSRCRTGAVQMSCRYRVQAMHVCCVCVLLCAGSLRGHLGVIAQDGPLDDLVRVEEVHPGELLRHRVLHRLLGAARPGRPHKVRVGVALPSGGLEWEWTS